MSPKAEQGRSEAAASAMSGNSTVLRRRRWRRRGRTGGEWVARNTRKLHQRNRRRR